MATHINIKKVKTIIDKKDWDQLFKDIKPRNFVRQESRELPDVHVLAEICRIVIDKTTPDVVKILCLKCLGNSCFDGYKHKKYIFRNIKLEKYNKNVYIILTEKDLCEDKNSDYPYSSHFPYDGIAEWSVDYIIAHDMSAGYLNDTEQDILRLSIQFLCNLFTYASKDITSTNNNDILRYLNCDNLKQAIVSNMVSDHIPLANASCIFVHNALKESQENYFTDDEKNHLCSQLLKSTKNGFTSSKESLFHILNRPNVFELIYNSITMSEKLDLLQIIYDKLWRVICETVQSDSKPILTDDAVEFLALTFCKRSDLILKTVESYVNSIDPTEVTLILNILGLLTSSQYNILENARCLIINCKYLLMSLHMMGKESDNYFTPIKSLSKVAPNAANRSINTKSAKNDDVSFEKVIECDIQDHPAYGFKAGIIKVIGNMVYKNKMCQDLFREIDGIPLLLDCCNIDARNPLILQWTIFAIKNLCEGNFENQEIIKNCKKEGLVDNPVLEEMGLALHEDAEGKSIRIAPLHNSLSSKKQDCNQ